MKNLTTAIYGKLSGSTLETTINGQLYKGQADQGAVFPYIVYFIVSDIPEYPGGKTIEQVLLQFSLFSVLGSSSEIEDMLTNLRALYDDVVLTITGNTEIYFIRGNMVTMRDELEGTEGVWHYVQEYEVWMVKT